jgi:hypothetical protein
MLAILPHDTGQPPRVIVYELEDAPAGQKADLRTLLALSAGQSFVNDDEACA